MRCARPPPLVAHSLTPHPTLLLRTQRSVISTAFGLAILDHDIFTSGLKQASQAVVVCFASGLVQGVLYAPFADDLLWPTDAMASRGLFVELFFGGLIAISGGAATVISITNADVSAIVGIAIAATLLPPTVNCGMCLSFATVAPYLGIQCDFEIYREIAIGSACLAIVNIFFIYATAWFVFWLKTTTTLVTLMGETANEAERARVPTNNAKLGGEAPAPPRRRRKRDGGAYRPVRGGE